MMRYAVRPGASRCTHGAALGGLPSLAFVCPVVADAAPLVTEIA
jgi:hypothetical protein